MRLLDRILRRDPEPRLRDDARVFTIGGGWGNHVSWLNVDSGTVYGHLPWDLIGADIRFPVVGDELRAPMKSGRTGRYVFVEVERQRDPDDMFIGTVSALGYVDEL